MPGPVRVQPRPPCPPEAGVRGSFLYAEPRPSGLPPSGFRIRSARFTAPPPASAARYACRSRHFGIGNSNFFAAPTRARPGERIKYTPTFENPNLPRRIMHVPVTLRKVSCRPGAEHHAGGQSRT